jgi:hypothetical protein
MRHDCKMTKNWVVGVAIAATVFALGSCTAGAPRAVTSSASTPSAPMPSVSRLIMTSANPPVVYELCPSPAPQTPISCSHATANAVQGLAADQRVHTVTRLTAPNLWRVRILGIWFAAPGDCAVRACRWPPTECYQGREMVSVSSITGNVENERSNGGGGRLVKCPRGVRPLQLA